MGLTGLLLAAGAARPHVLIAAMPGGTAVRLAAEQETRRRGWPTALSPADADVLLVAGTPAVDIAGAVEAVWAGVPAPRARAHITRPGEVAAALDAARAGLAGGASRRLPVTGGAVPPLAGQGGGDGGDGRARGRGGISGRRNGHGVGDHGAVSPGRHGNGMGETEMPGGLPMAERGEDRDGLKLDRLHVPLGPVLPDWPAGLLLGLTLQGDVVQHAEADAVGVATGDEPFWAEPWWRAAAGKPVAAGVAARWRAAAHLDSLGRLLAVAGWGEAALAARRLRDDTLCGRPACSLAPAVRRLAARVARSRMLAWSTRGMGMLRPGVAAAAGPDGPASRAAGDVTARYRHWCRELSAATALLDDGSPLDASVLEPARGPLGSGQAPSAALLAVLPRLLEGAELAAARLIVASLDPDLDELAAPAGAGHGG